MSTRVVLVDDNNLFRRGLCALIAEHSEFTVIADLRSGEEAVQASLDIAPDLLLMDVMLSGVNALDSVAQIKRCQPQIMVMMLTALKTAVYVLEALRVGADGYVLKDASIDELLTAMRCVARGKKYLSPDVSGQVMQSFLHPKSNGTRSSRLEMLTTRERGILQLIAEGRTNRSAAQFLSVSPKTVERHRASLMHKLGLRNAAELTLVALELGLVERPGPVLRLADGLNGA